MNLGHTTSTQAELWTVRQGLTSAWNIGYKQIILEIDSLMVIKMITTNMECMPLVSTLVFYCRPLLMRDWRVISHHIYCEANINIDFLANNGRTQHGSLSTDETCPSFLYQHVIWDMRHMNTTRLVSFPQLAP